MKAGKTPISAPTRDLRTRLAEADAEGVQSIIAEIAAAPPPNPMSIMVIGNALASHDQDRQALEWLLTIGPRDEPYESAKALIVRLLGRLGEHARVLDLTGDAPGQLSETMATARARSLFAFGRHREVVDLVRMLIENGGRTPRLLAIGADAAARISDDALALQFLEAALVVSPDAKLRLRRGEILFRLDRLDEALVAFAGVEEPEEAAVRSLSYIVRIQQRRGNSQACSSACLAVLERDPANVFALEAITRLYLDDGDTEAARGWFEEAHRRRPEEFTAEIWTFMVNERTTRFERALAVYDEPASRQAVPRRFKERVATAFYLADRPREALETAAGMTDPEARGLIRAKVDLARGVAIDETATPTNIEGTLARALQAYRGGEPRRCLSLLDGAVVPSHLKRGVGNFRRLILSGRVLPVSPVGRPTGSPGEPLVLIQQLWVGERLSYIEKLSIRSFLACGHEVHLYTYKEWLDAPAGCVLKDARAVVPETAIFAHSPRSGRTQGSLAGFADLFRWKLIYERGGAWADSDVICLEPIGSAPVVSCELARISGIVFPAITNCFFSASPGEISLLRAFETAAAAEHSELLWGEIGSHKMAEIVASEGWGARLAAPSDFCPIPPYRIIDAIEGAFDFRPLLRNAGCRAVHLYNEVMRMVALDKDGGFAAHGLISYLEARVAAREAKREQAESSRRPFVLDPAGRDG